MDACAVSMTNGMCNTKLKFNKSFLMAFMFGLFQGVMPLIGYFAGAAFSSKVSAVDHWIALVLLGIIGGKMIYDGFFDKDGEKSGDITMKLLFAQAVATSIDALAVGVSFAAMNVSVFVAVSVIALTTFILSLIAVFVGKKIGDKINNLAQIFGGSILVLIGLKIFIEHVFVK